MSESKYTKAEDWFQEHRLAWIQENAPIFGFVGSQHIMRKFNVSRLTADDDLRVAQKQYPTLALFLKTKPLPMGVGRPRKAKTVAKPKAVRRPRLGIAKPTHKPKPAKQAEVAPVAQAPQAQVRKRVAENA